MISINEMLVGGTVTRPPKMEIVWKGREACRFAVRMATWIPGKPPGRPELNIIEIVAYGPMAEAIYQRFDKGRSIFIVGRYKRAKLPDGKELTACVVIRWSFAEPRSPEDLALAANEPGFDPSAIPEE